MSSMPPEPPVPPASAASRRATARLSGMDRLVRNVVTSWATQLILIVLGFIMPRLIDHHVGQFSLGIWDFCWSIVSYLNLSGLGVGSSVNRYVALYRARDDRAGLNNAVATVATIQVGIAAFVSLATIFCIWWIPAHFAERLGTEAPAAQWVVAFLGATVAVRMLFDSARGVMTGCHRWDMHNGLNVGSQVVATLGMIVALVLGYGLEGMSVVYFVAAVATELVRVRLSARVCPELEFSFAAASWERAREMAFFGFKTVVLGMPNLVLTQTTNILVVGSLGPAALAVLSRPIALIRNVSVFIDKFGNVLTPTAGSLQELGNERDVQKFMLDATRFCVAITFPIHAMLAVYGDYVIQLWMGPDYVHHLVMVILAVGYFLSTGQTPVLRVMVGLNEHGKIGVIGLIVTVIGLVIGAVIVSRVGWSLPAAALLAAVPLTVANGIVTPWLSCRAIHLGFGHYLRYTFGMTLAIGAVFVGLLLASRSFPGAPWIAAIGASVIGGLWLAFAYWRYLLTGEMRARALVELRLRFAKRVPR